MSNNSLTSISSVGKEWQNFLASEGRASYINLKDNEYHEWFDNTIEIYGVKEINYDTCRIFFTPEGLTIFKLKFG